MTISSSPDPEADERWRQWVQKGRDSDARFQGRMRQLIWFAAGVFAIVGLWLQIR